MKSYGALWEKITSEENLYKAWRSVRKGHGNSASVLNYEKDLTNNISKLREKLLLGTYEVSNYWQFKLYDPKPRVITCSSVVDRIVHHALCQIISSLLEREFVSVSFACRKGYGSHRACQLARRYAGKSKYFCKMDIRKFFDNVKHEILLSILLPKFREKEVRKLLTQIITHPIPGQASGFGLPIGNLTSQWFANTFLTQFDHQALSGFGKRKPCGYLRYMDDFCFFSNSKAEAWRLHDEAKQWLQENLSLEIKDEATTVAPTSEGVPFLGLRIWSNSWRFKRSRFLRTRETYFKRLNQYFNGEITEESFSRCIASSDGSIRWFGFKNILKDLASEDVCSSGSNRVIRGGSYNNNASNCTASNRNNHNPSNDNNNNGFRLVSTMSEQTGFHSEMPVSQ